MANSTTGPTKQEIEAVFARLRSQAANKVKNRTNEDPLESLNTCSTKQVFI